MDTDIRRFDMQSEVFLTRAQPFHKGHIEVIRQILKENNKALVIIGSADKEDNDRNIFSIEKRLWLWQKILQKNIFTADEADRITLLTLNDLSEDINIPKQDNNTSIIDNAGMVNKEWGLYLYYNIVAAVNQKEFSIYYNDDISIINAWFPQYLQQRINIKQRIRIDGISSSKIRAHIKNKNLEALKRDLFYLTETEIEQLLNWR